jgi:hypothetical protein
MAPKPSSIMAQVAGSALLPSGFKSLPNGSEQKRQDIGDGNSGLLNRRHFFRIHRP